jgi:ankyrin repeat protein
MGSLAPRQKRKPLHEKKDTNHFLSRDDGSNFAETRFQNLALQIRDGAYPLHIAVAAGAIRPVLEMLIKEAPDILLMTNKFGETPLHVALATGAEDYVVELLIEHGADALQMKEETHNNLPIHYAGVHGCSVVVAKALLEHNLHSIHEINKDGKTALDLAMESGKCTEAVLRLFEISDNSEVPEEE